MARPCGDRAADIHMGTDIVILGFRHAGSCTRCFAVNVSHAAEGRIVGIVTIIDADQLDSKLMIGIADFGVDFIVSVGNTTEAIDTGCGFA